MVDYMHQIQTTAESYLHEEHSDYYNALLELLQQKQQLEANKEDTGYDWWNYRRTREEGKEDTPLVVTVETQVWTMDDWNTCDWI